MVVFLAIVICALFIAGGAGDKSIDLISEQSYRTNYNWYKLTEQIIFN